jgi:hypothetical protein
VLLSFKEATNYFPKQRKGTILNRTFGFVWEFDVDGESHVLLARYVDGRIECFESGEVLEPVSLFEA